MLVIIFQMGPGFSFEGGATFHILVPSHLNTLPDLYSMNPFCNNKTGIPWALPFLLFWHCSSSCWPFIIMADPKFTNPHCSRLFLLPPPDSEPWSGCCVSSRLRLIQLLNAMTLLCGSLLKSLLWPSWSRSSSFSQDPHRAKEITNANCNLNRSDLPLVSFHL